MHNFLIGHTFFTLHLLLDFFKAKQLPVKCADITRVPNHNRKNANISIKLSRNYGIHHMRYFKLSLEPLSYSIAGPENLLYYGINL